MRKNNQETVEMSAACCTARGLLWYLVFIGFAVNYMIRINLNIAIVDMIEIKPKSNKTLTSECLLAHPNDTTLLFAEFVTPIGTTTPIYEEIEKRNHRFHWNEKVQGSVLGSFFWLHWITQIPGGLLASKYGTKLVFGLSNFSGIVLCCFIPYFAKLGSTSLIILRLIQGLLCGFAWPSMHDMTARWIPPNERSKFVTAYLGSSVGTAITYPICGFIIHRLGWEYVFYFSSASGTIWFLAWWYLVYDSPSQHPKISQHEKEYILKSLGESVAKEKMPVPWKDIMTNVPVWMNILAQWGGIWGLFNLMTQAPTYFKLIHGWNIKATGILSGIPHIFRMLFAYIFSLFGDYLLRSNRMSRSNVRKLATVFSCGVQGIFMLALAYSGCNSMLAIVFLTLAVAMNGSVSTGALASIVDLSPNYAAVLMGFVNTAAAFVGMITPLVVGYITFQNQTTTQWQKVFWIASLWLFISCILYVIFSKSELQPWNSPGQKKQPEQEEELMVVVKQQQKD